MLSALHHTTSSKLRPGHRVLLGMACGAVLAASAAELKESASPAQPSQYYSRTWQTDDGLPRNSITCIAQTPNGYLWFGTPFGVIRFDGTTFTAMEGGSHEALARARTRVLHADQQGRLWIGTGTMGIIRYDGRTFTVINQQNGLPHPTVSSICEDRNQTVWVGTQDGNICRVDEENRAHPVEAFPSERLPDAVQLVRDRQGVMWFASRGTYGQLVDGVATNVTATTHTYAMLCPSRDGGMWVGAGNTVQKLSATNIAMEAASFPSPAAPSQMSTLFEDRSGNLWIGCPNQGLFRYSGGQWVLELGTPQRIYGMFEDYEANLWVGTEGGGLIRLRPRLFSRVAVLPESPYAPLLSVCETTTGERWLSAQGAGVMQLVPGGEPAFVSTFTNIRTTCVLPRPGGGIWAGTVNWGLFEVSGNEAVRVGAIPPFRNRQIRALHLDAAGDLWMGCLPDGLARLSGGTITPPQVYFDLGLPKQAIWAIADDPKGNLWLGTIRGELWRYDGNTFASFGTSNGLPKASIGALHFTSGGDLWIGTLGGGLGRMRDGAAVFANTSHGLADDVISSIVDDGLGWFWLSSDRGIIRVRKQELDEFADGQRDRLDAICYGKDDGLANLECLGGYQPSAWRFASGEICFTTSKGAVIVNPAAALSSNPPPQLLLEQVLVDGREASHEREPRFAYGYRNLAFKFTAPSFISPERIHFRHQLIGLDSDWVEADTERTASYPRLAPGRYEFRFTARHLDGPWNAAAVSFPFEITPAYWQTAWFRGAMLLAFSAVLAGAVRYRYVQKMRRKLRRLEQARAVEQERIRIARDIHDDLGARLTQMAFLSEMTARDLGENGRAGERLDKIAQGSRQAIRSLEEIVWAVNPRKDSLPHLVDYLSHYANEFFRTTDIRCRQDLPMMLPELPLSAETRHHLFLACKEALNNIHKHAAATEVWLRVAVADGGLQVIIEDDGKGFDPMASEGAGNGLANLEGRLASIGGRCEVVSKSGQGTRVRFTIKLPPAARQGSQRNSIVSPQT